MKLILCIAFLLSFCFAFAQKSNEVNVYSFQLKSGKDISLSRDTLENKLTYRCIKKGTVELEIVDDLNDTIAVFTYVYYFRGGGKANDGMDLNSIQFDNGGYHYDIYNNYSATEESLDFGIAVMNITSLKLTDLKGKTDSIEGSIIDFRFDRIIPVLDLR